MLQRTFLASGRSCIYLLLATYLPFVSSQPNPTCALDLTCVFTAIGTSGCARTDIACICESSGFIENIITCATTVCSGSELEDTLQAVGNLCENFGVTLSLSGLVTSTQASSFFSSTLETSSTSTRGQISGTSGPTNAPETPSPTETQASQPGKSSTPVGVIVGGVVADAPKPPAPPSGPNGSQLQVNEQPPGIWSGEPPVAWGSSRGVS
ncbi:hypothetical protein ABW19_dt0209367 [Dactylella cylindrospora]|nr:hypothetical protein ABW19_dt0209367 [Dactylella cylindrospora]